MIFLKGVSMALVASWKGYLDFVLKIRMLYFFIIIIILLISFIFMPSFKVCLLSKNSYACLW